MGKEPQGGFQPLPTAPVERLKAFAVTGKGRALTEKAHTRHDARRYGVPENPLLFVPTHPARAMYADLDVAGIEKKGFGGKVDFHAGRVAYVSFVIEAGANVKEAQSLARHVTPGLTLNTYARARQERLSELAESVGEMAGVRAEYAPVRTLAAAGAEGPDVNAIGTKGLGGNRNGGGGGNRTHVL